MDFEISDLLPAPPQVVYDTWLDSEGHAAITGSPVTARNEVGAIFQCTTATSTARIWSCARVS